MTSSFSILFGRENMLQTISVAIQRFLEDDRKIVRAALFWRSIFISSFASLTIYFVFGDENNFVPCLFFLFLFVLSGKMLYSSTHALMQIFYRIKKNASKMLEKLDQEIHEIESNN